MARDWAEYPTLALLEARLAERAPGNTAEFPISIYKELNDLDEWVWVVDIHVKVPGVTEYDITSSHPDYAKALKKAYLGLNNEGNLKRHAAHANDVFGVEV